MPEAVRVYLGLGTNLGERLDNLRQSMRTLDSSLKNLRFSSVYETEPWGFTDQPAFLNMVAAGDATLAPHDLLSLLKGLEQALGRRPSFRYGPRRIDLDILFYGDLVLDGDTLTIPHPRLAERAFVLVPLAELAPDLVHPVLHRTISDLLAGVDCSGVKFFDRFGNS